MMQLMKKMESRLLPVSRQRARRRKWQRVTLWQRPWKAAERVEVRQHAEGAAAEGRQAEQEAAEDVAAAVEERNQEDVGVDVSDDATRTSLPTQNGVRKRGLPHGPHRRGRLQPHTVLYRPKGP